jgi:hypothetical protein
MFPPLRDFVGRVKLETTVVRFLKLLFAGLMPGASARTASQLPEAKQGSQGCANQELDKKTAGPRIQIAKNTVGHVASIRLNYKLTNINDGLQLNRRDSMLSAKSDKLVLP